MTLPSLTLQMGQFRPLLFPPFPLLDSEVMGHVVSSGTTRGHHELLRVSLLYARQSTHIITFPPILRETLQEGIAFPPFTLEFYYLIFIRYHVLNVELGLGLESDPTISIFSSIRTISKCKKKKRIEQVF